jgi:hypothetical protein
MTLTTIEASTMFLQYSDTPGGVRKSGVSTLRPILRRFNNNQQ